MTPGPPPGQASADELWELVSPIALYPDLLVAQILVASTYPDQIVECDRWLKQNPKLSGDPLATAVNGQPWDPSIKSLTQFPQVVQTMSESLAWTSALGEAYYNQPADVMAAIQVMRGRAVDAGTLKDTPQQKVQVQQTTAGSGAAEGSGQPVSQQTVIVQPAQPNVVYVPQYNPTVAYGAPVQTPQGYTGSEMLMTGLLSFGTGIALGALINEGDNDWDCDWHGGGGGYVNYNRNVYVNNSRVPPRSNYAGSYARTTPASRAGARSPYTPAGPSTRPYNRDNARRYAEATSRVAKPTFPQPSSLGGNRSNPGAAGSRPRQQEGGLANRPGQSGNRIAQGNRPVTAQAAVNRPATMNRSAQQMRGYGGGRNPAGNRTGAFGGYQAGGAAQASSARGRGSFNGRGGSGGGGGGFSGGGGGAGRGRGGGGGARGGGGRRR